jgi:hypothetical protein
MAYDRMAEGTKMATDMMSGMSPKHMPQQSKSMPMSQKDMCKQGTAAMSKAKMSCNGGGSMG